MADLQTILLLLLLLSLTMKLANSSVCKAVLQPTPLISFLETLQKTAYTTYGSSSNFDPKIYMDVSLKFNLSKTEEAFRKLPKSRNGSVSVQDLVKFNKEFLNESGTDLVYHEPNDFVEKPVGFLENVENPEVKAWALEVHGLWKNLSRRVGDGVKVNPELHTLLPLPEPMIIPGSRFIEVYYWDSYWVIRLCMKKY
ncbi:alpha,alpha-trehalase [Ranunculus cassubicifolius]